MAIKPTGHTPGPWKFIPPDDQVLDLFSPEYFFIDGPGADVHGHMTIADARLIAAAPELLEALKNAVNALQICGMKFEHVEAEACAAIAKAEGGAA